jgi:dipeptidyl aminopeptidase/acylaminoacyl peptidase
MNKKTQAGQLAIGLAVLFLSGFPGVSGPLPQASTEEKRAEQTITTWLTLGPVEPALPAFAADKKSGFGPQNLLEFEEFEAGLLRPRSGQEILRPDDLRTSWKETAGGESGISIGPAGANPGVAYLAAYIETFRFTRARLTVTTGQLLQIYLDGRLTATKSKPEKDGRTAVDVRLETGKHLLLIKTVYDPETKSDWKIRASLGYSVRYQEPPPRVSVSPEENVSLRHILDGPRAAGISVSPDGSGLALTRTQTLPPSDDVESWLELYRIESGRDGLNARLVQTYRGGSSITRIVWAPDGQQFTYTTQDRNGGTIWLVDQPAGLTRPLLRNVKDLGAHAWIPDGKAIVFSVSEEGSRESALAKRYQSLEDRQPGQRNRSSLYRLTLPDGVRERLTSGELSTDFGGFSPDGKKLLFTRNLIDMTERPYSKTELFSLDLSTLKEELLWKGAWFNGAQWSPDGKNLLILGGPSAFGAVGRNIPKGRTANDYDIQAYLYDPSVKRAESITREFNPSVNQAFWAKSGEVIRFLTTDRSRTCLYEYFPATKTFAEVETGIDFIEQIDVASKAPVAALIGSSPTKMPLAYLLDLRKKEISPLPIPAGIDVPEFRPGKVETWTFKNDKGNEIDGFVFYPPDFDPAKKYPLIVNYYGGTTPIARDFGGRYPKAFYAAQGYIVYVLEPSGSIGYGQEFSALHVNDWGTIVAEEIMDGVRRFLAAHPFVDPRRVGCLGASYGGFMTKLLTTKTSMFSAAVSHAGISSISSYWGEGYWGYSYNAVAGAESFPWNRKDIFVTQSPLFNADKITTPLLLLHGSADTNVPPGESTQLFTALKLLGREVEYISFFEQNHHILTYNKRILWTKTILAWFDRWLKNEPEWWFDLYPPK